MLNNINIYLKKLNIFLNDSKNFNEKLMFFIKILKSYSIKINYNYIINQFINFYNNFKESINLYDELTDFTNFNNKFVDILEFENKFIYKVNLAKVNEYKIKYKHQLLSIEEVSRIKNINVDLIYIIQKSFKLLKQIENVIELDEKHLYKINLIKLFEFFTELNKQLNILENNYVELTYSLDKIIGFNNLKLILELYKLKNININLICIIQELIELLKQIENIVEYDERHLYNINFIKLIQFFVELNKQFNFSENNCI